MKRVKKVVVLVLIVLFTLSIGVAQSQVRCLATKSVADWNIVSAHKVAKWFVENRYEISEDFFRYEFYSDSEDLTMVFVRYELGNEDIVQEIIMRKEMRDGRKCYDVLFCGDRTMFLEYSENYGYGYSEVIGLYKVQDSF